MDLGRRRRNGVVAGSVWESRIKLDEVRGGIKVFAAEENPDGTDDTTSKTAQSEGKVRTNSKQGGAVGAGGKRKTWQSLSFEGSLLQIARQLDENVDEAERSEGLSFSEESVKKSTIQTKVRSEIDNEPKVFDDGFERSPIQKIKTRTGNPREVSVSLDGIPKNLIRIRKLNLESSEVVGESDESNSVPLMKMKSEPQRSSDESGHGNERVSIQLSKTKPVLHKTLDDTTKRVDRFGNGTERNSIGVKKTGTVDACKEFDVIQEKVISSSVSNVVQNKFAPKMVAVDNDGGGGCGDEEGFDDALEEEVDKEIQVEIEKKSFDIKEITIPEQKPKQVRNKVKKIYQVHGKSLPISPTVEQHPPLFVNKPRARTHSNAPKTIPMYVANEAQSTPKTYNKLQSLVDLVMWRDISKSALVFGVGTFVIIASSFTRDFNISSIAVLSYLSLVYLALIFLYRSIICRGAKGMNGGNQGFVLGEEDVAWLLKLLLPYLNELFLQLRALFCGDPATTMKMAVLLFVLARYGSSITIWNMAKLGFLGVFTLPKICSSYSAQLTAYGNFCIGRFGDAWETCPHKKAIGFAIVALLWSFSSLVARIWAVFMLFVAFKYYQQALKREDLVEEEAGGHDTWHDQSGGQRHGLHWPTLIGINKSKKAS